MSLRLGRVLLRSPHDVESVQPKTFDPGRLATGEARPALTGIDGKGWMLTGSESGSTAAALADAADQENNRFGAMFVQDTGSAVPTGYYYIDFKHRKPRGAPTLRRWDLLLVSAPAPLVYRKAYSDNVAGADTADSSIKEGYKVVYTPTTSEVLVLDPRNVAGAEPLNLPAGSYKVIARAYQATNSSAKLRLTTTKLDGTTITAGSQVAVGAAGAWKLLNLGTFTITATDAGANWFTLKVQGVASELGDVWIDRVQFVPV